MGYHIPHDVVNVDVGACRRACVYICLVCQFDSLRLVLRVFMLGIYVTLLVSFIRPPSGERIWILSGLVIDKVNLANVSKGRNHYLQLCQ